MNLFTKKLLIYREAHKRRVEMGWTASRAYDLIRGQYNLKACGRTFRNYLKDTREFLEPIPNSTDAANDILKPLVGVKNVFRGAIDMHNERAIVERKIALDLATHDVLTIVELPDAHVPNTDRRVVELACKLIEDVKPDHIVWPGDIFEFQNIGRHPVTMRERTVDVFETAFPELEAIHKDIQSAHDEALDIELAGNHGIRLDTKLTHQYIEFQQTIEKIFKDKLNELGARWLGWESARRGVPYVFGDDYYLWIRHGFKARKYNTAKAYADEITPFKVLSFSHSHRLDHHIMRGHDTYAHLKQHIYVTGCMQDPYTAWGQKHYQAWDHGVAVVRIWPKQQHIQFENLLIDNYTLPYQGKLYQAKQAATVYRMAA